MAAPSVELARSQRLFRIVGWMLLILLGAWAVFGAGLIAWSVRHPPNVVMVAALVGNVLVWLTLASALHRMLLRSFQREAWLLALLQMRSGADGR